MTTDLTFITNENGQSLKDRFNVLIKDARFFDALVGYFYTSGFYAIYRFSDDVINPWIGKYVSSETGMKALQVVSAGGKCRLVTSYSKLGW